MATLLALGARTAYKQYKMSQGKHSSGPAANAFPPSYESTLLVDRDLDEKNSKLYDATTEEIISQITNNIPSSLSNRPKFTLASQMALFPQYVTRKSETIIIKGRIRSVPNDSFYVQTIDGEKLFTVRGYSSSFSHRKRVFDLQGIHLFTIRKDILTIPHPFCAEDPEGKKIFEVESTRSVGSKKAEVCFTNALTRDAETLAINDSFFNKHTVMRHHKTGNIVPWIDREYWKSQEFSKVTQHIQCQRCRWRRYGSCGRYGSMS